MNEKKCIFNTTKICNDCGECYRCDLDEKKKCNNCGKCLELDGVDVRAIKIEEILEVNEEESKEENSYRGDIVNGADLSEGDPIWEYIDDIKDVKELLDHPSIENGVEETFPGLIQIKSKKENSIH